MSSLQQCSINHIVNVQWLLLHRENFFTRSRPCAHTTESSEFSLSVGVELSAVLWIDGNWIFLTEQQKNRFFIPLFLLEPGRRCCDVQDLRPRSSRACLGGWRTPSNAQRAPLPFSELRERIRALMKIIDSFVSVVGVFNLYQPQRHTANVWNLICTMTAGSLVGEIGGRWNLFHF